MLAQSIDEYHLKPCMTGILSTILSAHVGSSSVLGGRKEGGTGAQQQFIASLIWTNQINQINGVAVLTMTVLLLVGDAGTDLVRFTDRRAVETISSLLNGSAEGSGLVCGGRRVIVVVAVVESEPEPESAVESSS